MVTAIAAGIAAMIGFAGGWFARQQIGGRGPGAAEREARQRALEQEQSRLAAELHARDHSLSELSLVAESAQAAGQENRRLQRRVRDLEAALQSSGNRQERPSAALEMQLVMALKERDVAQKALLDLQGREAVLRNAAGSGSSVPDFPDLPDLDDTEDSDERAAPPERRQAPAGASDPDATLPPPDPHDLPRDPSDALVSSPQEDE